MLSVGEMYYLRTGGGKTAEVTFMEGLSPGWGKVSLSVAGQLSDIHYAYGSPHFVP